MYVGLACLKIFDRKSMSVDYIDDYLSEVGEMPQAWFVEEKKNKLIVHCSP